MMHRMWRYDFSTLIGRNIKHHKEQKPYNFIEFILMLTQVYRFKVVVQEATKLLRESENENIYQNLHIEDNMKNTRI